MVAASVPPPQDSSQPESDGANFNGPMPFDLLGAFEEARSQSNSGGRNSHSGHSGPWGPPDSCWSVWTVMGWMIMSHDLRTHDYRRQQIDTVTLTLCHLPPIVIVPLHTWVESLESLQLIVCFFSLIYDFVIWFCDIGAVGSGSLAFFSQFVPIFDHWGLSRASNRILRRHSLAGGIIQNEWVII